MAVEKFRIRNSEFRGGEENEELWMMNYEWRGVGNELLFSITDNVVYDEDGIFGGKIIGENIITDKNSSKEIVGNISEDNKYLIINIIEEDDVL